MKFAAHDDVSIYAVADSADGAVEKAKHDARDPKATFEASPISDDLATWIEDNGWNAMNRSFEVDRNTGYIVDTTGATDE